MSSSLKKKNHSQFPNIYLINWWLISKTCLKATIKKPCEDAEGRTKLCNSKGFTMSLTDVSTNSSKWAFFKQSMYQAWAWCVSTLQVSQLSNKGMKQLVQGQQWSRQDIWSKGCLLHAFRNRFQASTGPMSWVEVQASVSRAVFHGAYSAGST